MAIPISTAKLIAIFLGLAVVGLPAAAQTRGYTKPTSSQIHGLIIAVSEYDSPIVPLKGIAHDVASAIEISRRMGVATDNLRVVQKQDATLAGIRKAFDDLQARLQIDDQVFIYFSGHGGRSIAIDEPSGDRCAESLIASNGYGMLDSEMENRLKKISLKAQKVVAFIDACHSGGVTTRGVQSLPKEFTPKYWSPKGTSGENCAKPTNLLTRGLSLASREVGNGGNNVVYIAAAQDNEVSFDLASKGGVATQAWLTCMSGAAKDIDRSGGISAEELRVCAQEQVNKALKNASGVLPSHVSITGNRNLVLSYAAHYSTAPNQQEEIPAPSPPAKFSPVAALKDIYNSRDDRRLVTIKADKQKLVIGQDQLSLTLTSRESGYVYLLMAGSDGKAFDLLFPNKIDDNNQIKAGESITLPRGAWQVAPQGPVGTDTLLAIISTTSRDFSPIESHGSGVFSTIYANGATDLQKLLTAGKGYGAVLINIEEGKI